MRTATIKRKTQETDIALTLTLEGDGSSQIQTGCGFLDHMLTLFTKHGHFSLQLVCQGDLEVDAHHTVEDIAICLGQAVYQALGDKKGIYRYADIHLPMDEALLLCAMDISGRGAYYGALDLPTEKVGDFDCQLCDEFMIAFAQNAGITLHLRQITGRNSHHIIEGAFKALGRCLAQACAIDEMRKNEIPSTKGSLG